MCRLCDPQKKRVPNPLYHAEIHAHEKKKFQIENKFSLRVLNPRNMKKKYKKNKRKESDGKICVDWTCK